MVVLRSRHAVRLSVTRSLPLPISASNHCVVCDSTGMNTGTWQGIPAPFLLRRVIESNMVAANWQSLRWGSVTNCAGGQAVVLFVSSLSVHAFTLRHFFTNLLASLTLSALSSRFLASQTSDLSGILPRSLISDPHRASLVILPPPSACLIYVILSPSRV